jgi:hypothetical protein
MNSLWSETMKKIKYIHVNEYVAEVEVNLIESEPTDQWGPYLSLDDAYRLDDVKQLLQKGSLAEASRQAKIIMLTPIASTLRRLAGRYTSLAE